ncbi:hypothetical protein F2Q70_00007258 [Brassica cretica]|uniref:RING-type domain-containing protein n=1 Tax=Brassica cretica TaxID=69181 RepID=A0A8S9M8W3_BRACR|nr:hypothetical protein F2Q70_00007258 [Brassica cretica]
MRTIIKTSEFTVGEIFGLQLGKTWKDSLGLLNWEQQRHSGSDTYNGQEAGQIKDAETEEACLMWAPPITRKLPLSVSRPRARESLIVFGKMNTGGRLIAGSHNRNEFVLINADESARIRSVEELSGQSCQICGDEIELSDDGESFVACNECAFPVCRTCYEYERREGNQSCPQCKTRYKRIKGDP